MEDSGVIDISPDEATFGNTKSHSASAKNKLVSAYEYDEKVYDKSDAPGSSSANSLSVTNPVNASSTMTDNKTVKTQFKANPSGSKKLKKIKKIHSEQANTSTTEETSFSISDHTMTYPAYPSYSDYEEVAPVVPSYDYQDYQLEERLVRLPYDFSGLQFSQLSENPRVWNSQDAFLEQVGYKLYMFIPAGLAGILLGVFLWIIAMIILRAYGLAKKAFLRFIQKGHSEDLEMGSSCHAKESDSSEIKKIHPVKKLSRHVRSDYFASKKVSELITNEKSSIQKDNLENNDAEKSASSQSTQSSPVSLSSGIGVSERESGDERDSLASCKEFDHFERGGAENRWDRRTVSDTGGGGEGDRVSGGEDEDRVVYRVESLREKCCRRNSD